MSTNRKYLNEAQAVNTWGAVITESFGVTDKSKLGWMSQYAEIHSDYDKQNGAGFLTESAAGYSHLNPNATVMGMGNGLFPNQNTTGSGDTPLSMLPVALQVAAQTIGFDLVRVVPMPSFMGMLTYLDFVYNGGNIGPKNSNQYDGNVNNLSRSTDSINGTKVGQYFGDTFGGASPYIVKWGRGNTTAPGVGPDGLTYGRTIKVGGVNWVQEADGTWTGSNVVVAKAPATMSGFTPAVNSTAPDGTTTQARQALIIQDDYWQLTWIGTSRIDGKDIWIVKGNAGTASAPVWAPGVEVDGHPLYASGASFASAGTGFGVATTDETSGTTTVSNQTYPELVKALEDHIPNFSGDLNTGLPYERGYGEMTPMRDMSLSMFTKAVKAKTVQVSATVTQEQIDDINNATGLNVIAQIQTILMNELTQAINKDIIMGLESLGTKNLMQWDTMTKFSRFFTNTGVDGTIDTSGNMRPIYGRYFNYNAEGDIDMNSYNAYNVMTNAQIVNLGNQGSAETLGTIQRRILSALLVAKNHINVVGRRGPATYCVVSGAVGAAIQDVIGFQAYPIDGSVNTNGNLYPMGTVAGLTVYVDPYLEFGSGKIIVGRKGGPEEPGLVYCPYILAHSVQTIVDSGLHPKIGMKSRYCLVEAGFHPELQVITFGIQWDTNVGISIN